MCRHRTLASGRCFRLSWTMCRHMTLASGRCFRLSPIMCRDMTFASGRCFRLSRTMRRHRTLASGRCLRLSRTICRLSWPLLLEDVSNYHGQCVDTGLLLSADVSMWSQTICLWTQDPCLWQMLEGHHVYFANKWPFALSWCDGVLWKFLAHSTLASMRCDKDITDTLWTPDPCIRRMCQGYHDHFVDTRLLWIWHGITETLCTRYLSIYKMRYGYQTGTLWTYSPCLWRM